MLNVFDEAVGISGELKETVPMELKKCDVKTRDMGTPTYARKKEVKIETVFTDTKIFNHFLTESESWSYAELERLRQDNIENLLTEIPSDGESEDDYVDDEIDDVNNALQIILKKMLRKIIKMSANKKLTNEELKKITQRIMDGNVSDLEPFDASGSDSEADNLEVKLDHSDSDHEVSKDASLSVFPTTSHLSGGPPGKYKKRLAENVANTFQLSHLSIPHVISGHVRKGSALGKIVKLSVKTGIVIPDNYLIKFVKQSIASLNNKSFVITGFPSTFNQAWLFWRDVKLNIVIYPTYPEDVLMDFLMEDLKPAATDIEKHKKMIEVRNAINKHGKKIQSTLKFYEKEKVLITCYSNTEDGVWEKVKKIMNNQIAILNQV
ncbi:hypothetical protein RN001_014382 [Aquatica leii]|uniref:Uncharacterized protein n=1 Tax=Aquatica leii TaxID=1421715 RepID=A0AAN7SKH7_9COLE|nr:hypothetical protein RN001_014382 [Aquatica leii]